LKKGITNSTVYDIKAFEEKYLLKVNQFVDFKALKGDPSDNIPGVKGIGEKTAMEILTKYISLDNIFENMDKFLSDPMLKEKDKK
jgi:DNA polymerase I